MTLELLGKFLTLAMLSITSVSDVNKVGCLMCVCAQIQNTHENVKDISVEWSHPWVEALPVAPVMESTLLTCIVNYI